MTSGARSRLRPEPLLRRLDGYRHRRAGVGGTSTRSLIELFMPVAQTGGGLWNPRRGRRAAEEATPHPTDHWGRKHEAAGLQSTPTPRGTADQGKR